MKDISYADSKRYLWFICLVSAGGGLLFGYDAVVMSGTIPIVIEQFHITSFQLGFLVSCVLWGCALGSALGGILIDNYGRKKIIVLSASIILLSSIWSGLAAGPIQLVISRLIGGIGGGLATIVCPLYISEVSPKETRGRMGSLYHFSVCLGIVLCVFINWGIYIFSISYQGSGPISEFLKWFAIDQYWRAMFFFEAVPGIIFLICSCYLPESPRWLSNINKIERAEAVLTRINGKTKAKIIILEIRETINKKTNIRFSDLFSLELRKPFRLAILICIFAEACGISAVLYYGPQLLEQSGLSLGSSLGGFAVIAIVNLLFNFVAIKYMDSVGRKKLLIIGAAGSMCSLLILGTFYLLGVSGFIITIPIITFIAFFAFSVGPIKFIIISEIFPNQIRGKAISVATVGIWLTSAAVAQLFPMMRDIMPTGYIFYLFAIDLAALLVISIFFLPETKGRTIEEINKSWFLSTRKVLMSKDIK